MTQSQLNRAVARATGEDIVFIDQQGFSLIDEDPLLNDDDIEALMLDWDQIQAEQNTALFPDRQVPQAA